MINNLFSRLKDVISVPERRHFISVLNAWVLVSIDFSLRYGWKDMIHLFHILSSFINNSCRSIFEDYNINFTMGGRFSFLQNNEASLSLKAVNEDTSMHLNYLLQVLVKHFNMLQGLCKRYSDSKQKILLAKRKLIYVPKLNCSDRWTQNIREYLNSNISLQQVTARVTNKKLSSWILLIIQEY